MPEINQIGPNTKYARNTNQTGLDLNKSPMPIISPTTILEHHSSLKSFSSGDATGKRGGSAAESSPQAIMPCRY
jgi:hypothetical protein